jgi:hypothetical protein
MRRSPRLASACALFAIALAAAPARLAAQQAGEAALGITLSLGSRSAAVLTAKVFVRDELAVHCAWGSGGEHRVRGCGASLYGVAGWRNLYATLELGDIRVYPLLPPPPPARPGEPPPVSDYRPGRAYYLNLGVGVQARSPLFEEMRPFVAVGPALVFGGFGGALAEDLYGIPDLGGLVQPLFFVDAGTELYVLSR